MKKIILGMSLIVLFIGCSGKNNRLFKNEDTIYISKYEVTKPMKNKLNRPIISKYEDINIQYESRVLPDDILNIEIYNMNQRFNILSKTEIGKKSEYLVTADGTIYLPLLHEVKVKGLTAKELSVKLTEKYKKYLKQPYAKATITNHKIYVLGEVKKQGIVPLAGNSISVIEAISHSGGLTDYAVQSRIRIISKEDGKHKIRTLDLTKLSTLNIDNIMLKHDSIVYIEPTSSKALRVGVKDYLPVLQVISSLASSFLAIDYISN